MRSYEEYNELNEEQRIEFLLNQLDRMKHYGKNLLPEYLGYPSWGTAMDIAYNKIKEAISKRCPRSPKASNAIDITVFRRKEE